MDSPLNDSVAAWCQRFLQIRQRSARLAAGLSEADAQLQSMADVSPTKWHLAHTTWFFETVILAQYCSGYQRPWPEYNYLFNSYYNGIGEQYPRHQRGLISRPSLSEVMQYRHHVEQALLKWLQESEPEPQLLRLLELGLQHEQQHQELMVTDIKHCLFHNPLYPTYQSSEKTPSPESAPLLQWQTYAGGLVTIGWQQNSFSFDNEKPAHQVYLQPYQLASRLVTNGEYLEFIESGGYQQPQYWLADGWAWLQQTEQQYPLYWLKKNNQWHRFTCYGLLPLNEQEPAIHVNYYEAMAYAQWGGARLPTEFEWESAVCEQQLVPAESAIQYEPEIVGGDDQQFFNHAWQWTSSSYSPYPGFEPFAGVAGEYNGKFMSNQQVLRGSSCVTPAGHSRVSYRNFFYAHQSWQYTGIRLAKTVKD